MLGGEGGEREGERTTAAAARSVGRIITTPDTKGAQDTRRRRRRGRGRRRRGRMPSALLRFDGERGTKQMLSRTPKLGTVNLPGCGEYKLFLSLYAYLVSIIWAI